MMQQFFPDSFVHALGMTLAHSLWQGAAFALALWFLLPRLGGSRARYRAAFLALGGIAFSAVATFFWVGDSSDFGNFSPKGVQWTNSRNHSDSPQLVENQLVENWQNVGGKTAPPCQRHPLPGEISSPEGLTFWQSGEAGMASACTGIRLWLENHAPFVVAVWFFGFAFFLIRLLSGLHYVGQLRSRKIRPVESNLQNAFEMLLEKSACRKTIALLESGLAQTPMVIGFLKPAILLPVAVVNQLSPPEIEAVLAHELAHILRRDWVLNLAQAFIEAVFYYHPAVWWVSGIVRAERENCCDDFAVSLCGSRLFYAKTLLRVQEIAREQTAPVPALALALEGNTKLRKPMLLNRIRRILNQSHTKSPLMEKLTASAILLALLALWSVKAESAPIVFNTLKDLAEAPVEWVQDVVADAPEDLQIVESQVFAQQDSVPGKRKNTQTIKSDDGEKQVEITLEDGKMTALKIDGKDIPESDFEKYEDLTDDVLVDAMPPMPSMPPFPDMPALAPMAEMPCLPGMPAMPPVPAPFPGNSARIISEKDANGNTIIRLDHSGNATEIVVKDGAVFIDGKKVENGQSIELKGGGDNGYFFWNGDDGTSLVVDGSDFKFSPEGFHFEGLDEEEKAKMMAEMEESREEMEQKREEMRQDMNQRREELRERERELVELQRGRMRELQDAQREAKREALRAERELQRAQEENQHRIQELQRGKHRNNAKHRGGDFGHALKMQLQSDGVLADPSNYSIELSSKSLKVNGKKQSAETHRRCLDLYREFTGEEMGKGDKVSYAEKN